MSKKEKINIVERNVSCSCGNQFTIKVNTKATSDIHQETCNACHPIYTGVVTQTASGGQIDRFKDKYGL